MPAACLLGAVMPQPLMACTMACLSVTQDSPLPWPSQSAASRACCRWACACKTGSATQSVRAACWLACSRPSGQDQQLGQRVGAQPVGPMQAYRGTPAAYSPAMVVSHWGSVSSPMV